MFAMIAGANQAVLHLHLAPFTPHLASFAIDVVADKQTRGKSHQALSARLLCRTKGCKPDRRGIPWEAAPILA
ncbi:hypothetical protein [Novosphingobium sp.]|uniref:hypothetical protein n=1 Tax=Novosphingobium sp. TaxID=1874826 RepID=UPI001E0FF512|nr:hypothetical protein [Novosphingobium sp.]MBX9665374.1 hypothetical protein [Novosphingobium sp.]